MKLAINNDGIEVEVLDDTVVNTINGVHYLLTFEQKIELDARNAAWEAEATRRNALVEIARLEGQITPRRQREAILSIDDGWLAAQEALIAIERAKL